MEYGITLIVVAILALIAFHLAHRCKHYYGVPYCTEDEMHQSCYKCGKVRTVKLRKLE